MHKVTHAHQNHKTCSTSWAYSSKSDGGCHPHHVKISESTETDLKPGASPVFIAACIHELQAFESHQFQRLQAGPGFYTRRR